MHVEPCFIPATPGRDPLGWAESQRREKSDGHRIASAAPWKARVATDASPEGGGPSEAIPSAARSATCRAVKSDGEARKPDSNVPARMARIQRRNVAQPVMAVGPMIVRGLVRRRTSAADNFCTPNKANAHPTADDV